jgi:hypothetical protein
MLLPARLSTAKGVLRSEVSQSGGRTPELEASPAIGEAGRAEGDHHRGLLRWRLDNDAARSRLCGPVILVGACVFANGRDNPSKVRKRRHQIAQTLADGAGHTFLNVGCAASSACGWRGSPTPRELELLQKPAHVTLADRDIEPRLNDR